MSLFHQVVPTQVFSCEYCEIFNTISERLLLIVVFKSNEDQHLLAKIDKMCYDERNYVLYLSVLFWYYYICILSRSSRTEVFLKKVFLKTSHNLRKTPVPESLFEVLRATLLMKRLPHNVIQNR